MIPSYSSVFALGHSAIKDILKNQVTVEEKVDGSQFSMKRSEELEARSKGKQIVIDAPEKMFNLAIKTAKELENVLAPGWTYRCEYLSKPKHNSLKYDRVPEKNLVVFDVDQGLESHLSYKEKVKECQRIGLECVPLLYEGTIENWEFLKDLLKTQSCLGGTTIEGFVIKNYSRFTEDKKFMAGKFVSEQFKERQKIDWKNSNPTQGDIIVRLRDTYKTEPRWQKAVQHLRELGKVENAPKDIGALILEVQADIEKECKDEIKDILWSHSWPKLKRSVVAGLAEWYKEQLAKSAFKDE